VGGHEVIETAKSGASFVGAPLNPVYSQAYRGPTDHRQIQRGHGITDATAIFSSRDIQAQMQAILYAPVVAVSPKHVLR
jgi:hypothetical protein